MLLGSRGSDTVMALSANQAPLVFSKVSNDPAQCIEQLVNRSTERRRREVENKKGHIPRPLNSFMLYRKAYQAQAKQVLNLTHHQLISGVVAASWRHETRDVIAKFVRFAQIEKDNHQLAFPNYRFVPKRSAQVEKARRKTKRDDRSNLRNNDNRDREERFSEARKTQLSKQHDHSLYKLPHKGELQSVLDEANPLNPTFIPQHRPNQGIKFGQSSRRLCSGMPHCNNFDFGILNPTDIEGPAILPYINDYPEAKIALPNVDDFGPPIQHATSQGGHSYSLASIKDDRFAGAFVQSEFDGLRPASLGAGWEEQEPTLNGTMALLETQIEDPQHDSKRFTFLEDWGYVPKLRLA